MSFRGAQRWRPEIGKKHLQSHFEDTEQLFHSCPPDVTHDENSEIETVLLSNECIISS